MGSVGMRLGYALGVQIYPIVPPLQPGNQRISHEGSRLRSRIRSVCSWASRWIVASQVRNSASAARPSAASPRVVLLHVSIATSVLPSSIDIPGRTLERFRPAASTEVLEFVPP